MTAAGSDASHDTGLPADPPDRLELPPPRPRSAVFFAPSISIQWVLGALLFAAAWLPQVTGCDGTVVVPIEETAKLVAGGQPAEPMVRYWMHVYGALIGLIIAVGVCWQRVQFDRFLAVATFSAWVLIQVTVIGGLVAGQASLRDFLMLSLPVCLPWVWCLAAMRRRDWTSAWARLASCIGVSGILFTSVIYLFRQQAHYGLVVTYVALTGLSVSPWVWWARWQRDVFGAGMPIRKPRFRIWHFIVSTALLALVITFYRLLPMLVGD